MVDKHRETVPLLNCLQDTEGRWLEVWAAFHTASAIYSSTHTGRSNNGGLLLIQTHKDLFGRQDYCFTTYRRHWVWEFEGYRVWVHNEAGITLEVEVGTTPEEAVAYMQAYIDQWPFDIAVVERLDWEGILNPSMPRVTMYEIIPDAEPLTIGETPPHNIEDYADRMFTKLVL